MKALTLEDVLAVEDLPVENVEVAQWGGFIGVRSLRADYKSEIERQFSKKRPGDDPAAFRRALLKATLVNPDKSNFLPTDEAATLFMQKNAEAVEVLVEKAMALNGFREKDVKALEKNC
jgi:hypothetical protein